MKKRSTFIFLFLIILAATALVIISIRQKEKLLSVHKKVVTPVYQRYVLSIGIQERNPGYRGDLDTINSLLGATIPGTFYELLDSKVKCSKINILKQLWNFSTKAKSGDIVYIYFTGHGKQVPDDNGDESRLPGGDGMDEVLVLYDGEYLRDDEINKALCDFAKGVQVVFIVDACSAGTVIAFDGSKISFNAELIAKEGYQNLNAEIISLGASMDGRGAKPGDKVSLFTGLLFDENKKSPKLNYLELSNKILKNMPDEMVNSYLEMSSSGICTSRKNNCQKISPSFSNQLAFSK